MRRAAARAAPAPAGFPACRACWWWTTTGTRPTALRALLRLLGAEVRVVHDGAAALEALDAFNPVAVFLDLGMPGMDGYEAARRIRAQPGARDTVLIAVTGWGQDARPQPDRGRRLQPPSRETRGARRAAGGPRHALRAWC